MIILDTNVVSEPLKPQANMNVVAWLDAQIAETLYLTSINLAELLSGVEVLPIGKRKASIETALNGIIIELFSSRILPFDAEAAKSYTGLMAKARGNGQSISFADGQIAAIALVHGSSVATRDTAPFLAAGVNIINPWNEV